MANTSAHRLSESLSLPIELSKEDTCLGPRGSSFDPFQTLRYTLGGPALARSRAVFPREMFVRRRCWSVWSVWSVLTTTTSATSEVPRGHLFREVPGTLVPLVPLVP